MTPNNRCTLGVTDETLSALYDDLLPLAEATALRGHILGCAACQGRMTALAEIGTLLRARPAPDRRDELWRSLGRARALHTDQRGRQVQRWSGLGAIGAVLVAILLFVLLIPHGTTTQPAISSMQPTATLAPSLQPTPTAVPITTAIAATGSPVQGPQIQWQKHSFPTGYTQFEGNIWTLAIAPSDPTTAYLCGNKLSDSPTEPAHVFVTHDAAAHWTEVSTIPQLHYMMCHPFVDANDPQIVVAGNNYLSRDGGSTWQPFPKLTNVMFLSSWQQTFYAVGQLAGEAQGGAVQQWYVSRDNMHTWQPFGSNLPNTSFSLTVSPFDGEILAVTGRVNTAPAEYWRSRDSGQHWQRAVAPGDVQFVVPRAAGQWRLCTVRRDLTHVPASITFICSTDDGKTWVAYPPFSNANDVPSSNPFEDSVAPDGSLYVFVTNTAQHFFRLPPGATRWQSLGSPIITSGGSHFYPAPQGGGTFWNTDSNKGPGDAVATAPDP